MFLKMKIKQQVSIWKIATFYHGYTPTLIKFAFYKAVWLHLKKSCQSNHATLWWWTFLARPAKGEKKKLNCYYMHPLILPNGLALKGLNNELVINQINSSDFTDFTTLTWNVSKILLSSFQISIHLVNHGQRFLYNSCFLRKLYCEIVKERVKK